jgi:hypothetical protein
MTRDAAQRALAELRADGAVHEALIAEIAAYLQRFDPPEG